MKTNHFIKFAALLLVCCAMLGCGKEDDTNTLTDNYGTISGTVIDLDTSEPIQKATVTLSPNNYSVFTDDDGQFEFLDLDARQYAVTVQKAGYITTRKTVMSIVGGNVIISLTLKKNQ